MFAVLAALSVSAGTAMINEPATDAPKIIRVNCGSDKEHIDEEGNVWEADTRYFGTDPNQDGRTVNRGDMEITYTTIPSIYRTERFFYPPDGRNTFSYPVPNGRYLVRLHFVETLGVGRGLRMQKMIIEGKETEVIDIVRAAGGVRMALVKEYETEVADGELNIRFQQTAHDSAMVNGIEIVPLK
jgi:hypothetical protein